MQIDETQGVLPGQRLPERMGGDRLTRATHQAITLIESPAVEQGGQAAAPIGRRELGMWRPNVGVDAASHFAQAVEDGIAGEPAFEDILDVEIVLAIGLAVVDAPTVATARKTIALPVG